MPGIPVLRRLMQNDSLKFETIWRVVLQVPGLPGMQGMSCVQSKKKRKEGEEGRKRMQRRKEQRNEGTKEGNSNISIGSSAN